MNFVRTDVRWTPPPARRRGFSRPDAQRPVVVELEGVSGEMRVRITEDSSSYGVMMEFGSAGDEFDVELDGHRVFITMTQMRPACAGSVPALQPASGCISLAFGEAIDALSSHGECANGLLHLSLRKEAPRCTAQPAE